MAHPIKVKKDFSNIQDVTKSVDQLCEHLSINNVVVPRIDAYKDVFEFINEFELVSATLPDEKKNKLLVKAFPPGRLRAWFDGELKSLITANSDWQTIKNKIIERYSNTEDRDRHFKRLQTLKFNPQGNVKLYDHVEDLLYSFSKAFPNESDADTKIRYVKSNLPSAIQFTLTSIHEYNSAKTLPDFMKAMKQYDILKTAISLTRTLSPLALALNVFDKLTSSLNRLSSNSITSSFDSPLVIAGILFTMSVTPFLKTSPNQTSFSSWCADWDNFRFCGCFSEYG